MPPADLGMARFVSSHRRLTGPACPRRLGLLPIRWRAAATRPCVTLDLILDSLRVTVGELEVCLTKSLSRACSRTTHGTCGCRRRPIANHPQTNNIEPLPGDIIAICTPPLDHPASLGLHQPPLSRPLRAPVSHTRTNIHEEHRPWCFPDGRKGPRYLPVLALWEGAHS
jgi:hypothetical protein